MNDQDRTPGTPDETEATPDETSNEPAARRHPLRPVVVVTVIALLGLLATAGFKSYRDLATARGYERQLLDEIRETEERLWTLDRRIDRIRHDPVTLERLAREDLGMVRAGDVVIVLPEEEAAEPHRTESDSTDLHP